MAEREYPTFDDPRIHFDQVGVYFDLPLASYITDPPDLTKKGIRHSMQLPDDPDDLETHGFNAADGAAQLQDTIPLRANRDVDILVDARAFSDARIVYSDADLAVRRAYARLKIDRDNARGWLMTGKGLLINSLGRKPSAEWADAGWSDESLQVPVGEEALMPMLRKVAAYLTAHPGLVVTSASFNFTPARANELRAALDGALNNADTTGGKILGVNPAEAKREAAYNVRELTKAALERRLRGLYGELEQNLDPLSPNWVVFGFDQPGATNAPDPVESVTATAVGGGRIKLEWPGTARSDRFQIWMKREGEAAFKRIEGTEGELEKYIEGETPGAKLKFKVRGVNATNYGPFSPEVEVTVT